MQPQGHVYLEAWGRGKADEVAGSRKPASSPRQPSHCEEKDDMMLTTKPRLQRGGSSASLHNSLMRNSIFQLMIHTLDPLAEGMGHKSLQVHTFCSEGLHSYTVHHTETPGLGQGKAG
uniref:Uncharacterized protein n=1 Tax=Sphaerodactylus townsendi TaxID=933632 RepID=A0ACB8ERI0_9SAUR